MMETNTPDVTTTELKITCRDYPPEFITDKTLCKTHFRQFGRVKRIIFKQKQKIIIVEYATINDYNNALNKAGEYNEIKFEIQPLVATEHLHDNRKKVVTEHKVAYVNNDEIKQELAAMGGYDLVMDSAPKVTSQVRKLKRQWKKEVPTELKSSTPVTTSIQKPKVIDIPLKKSSMSPEQQELLKIIRSQAGTADEKYKILDARDKLLRIHLKKHVYLKSTATVGTCPDMCPEKERLMREVQHQVSLYEQDDTDRHAMDPNKAVKQYSRSSADQETPLPHELRPVSVLQMTMAYLMYNIMDLCDSGVEVNTAEWYHFLWDRTRGIRKDITQQALCCQGSVELVEQCARFHIHCSARLVAEDPSVFDQKINTENLTKCLQTLKYMYHDLRLKGQFCPNEAEFRAYIILLNMNDGNFMWEVQELDSSIQKSSEVKFALEVYSAFDKRNYVKFFKLIKNTTYLNACILMRYFVQVRVNAVETFLKCFTSPKLLSLYPADELTSLLGFDDKETAIDFLSTYGMSPNKENTHFMLVRGAFKVPEFPYLIDRSHLVENKRITSVGNTVCGKEMSPEVILGTINHEIQNSFDNEGYLIYNEEFYADDVSMEIIDENLKATVEQPQKNIFGRDSPINRKGYHAENAPEIPERKNVFAQNILQKFPTSNIFSQKIPHSQPQTNGSELSETKQIVSQVPQSKTSNIFANTFSQDHTDGTSIFAKTTQPISIFNQTSENIFEQPSKSIFKVPDKSNKNIFPKPTPSMFGVDQRMSQKPPSESKKGGFTFALNVPVEVGLTQPPISSTNEIVSNIIPVTTKKSIPSFSFVSRNQQSLLKTNENKLEIKPATGFSFSSSSKSQQQLVKPFQIKQEESKSIPSYTFGSNMVNQKPSLNHVPNNNAEIEAELQRQKEEEIKLLEEQRKQILQEIEKEEEREKEIQQKKIEEQLRLQKEKERAAADEKRKLEEQRRKEIEEAARKIKEEEQRKITEEQNRQKQLRLEEERKQIERDCAVNTLIGDLLNDVNEHIRKERLQKLTHNIKKRLALKVYQHWKESAYRSARKRKAFDCSPGWINSMNPRQCAKEFATPSQELSLKNMKRYKYGKPLDIPIIEAKEIRPINIHNLTYPLLRKRLLDLEERWYKHIYWKIDISINEGKNFPHTCTEALDNYINWASTEYGTVYLESEKSATYCLEKQYTNTNKNDANGYIFIANSFNLSLQKRVYELLKNYGVQTKLPVVAIFGESVSTECKTYFNSLKETGVVSEFIIFSGHLIPDTLIQLVDKALKFLATNVEKSSPLELDTLYGFFNRNLCTEIWRKAGSFAKWNSEYQYCMRNPNIVISLYNEALKRLKQIALSNNSKEYSSFPAVFKNVSLDENPAFLPCNYRYFPTFWSDPQYEKELDKIFNNLKLPKFTEVWPPQTEEELFSIITNYCSISLRHSKDTVLAIFNNMQSQIQKHGYLRILWVNVIETLALAKLTEQNFTLIGTKFAHKIFKTFIVVYNVKEINDYISSDWFYRNNDMIEQYKRNWEPGRKMTRPSTVDSSDILDVIAKAERVLKSPKIKCVADEEKNLRDIKTKLEDLDKSIQIMKKVSALNVLEKMIKEH